MTLTAACVDWRAGGDIIGLGTRSTRPRADHRPDGRPCATRASRKGGSFHGCPQVLGTRFGAILPSQAAIHAFGSQPLERQTTSVAASKQTGQAGLATLQQLPQNVTMQQQLDACMAKLEDFVDELSEIGCELKDYQMGLIDFVGRHEGRDIYLCWKLGEESITHWHELDSGFAGRQPVSKLKESK
jgi:hypothetical protein